VTVTQPPAASGEHLTAVLQRAGVLGAAEAVSDVVVETSRETLISSIARLRLAYHGSAGQAPSHLFLKFRRGDLDPALAQSGQRECAFYTTVAVATPPGLLPRCYEAVVPPDGAWHLLLEDLTATHEAPGDWPVPPRVERSDRIIEAHARFHAHWWDDARLGVSVGTFLDSSGRLDQTLASFAKNFASFADRLGDRLSPERRAIFEGLLVAAPHLLARYRSHRNLTIVHGDAHMWNAMLPRDPRGLGLRLIDWDAWRIDVATDDLAYMMALYWTPDRRRQLERPSLERYHETLVAHGVQGYDFDALWRDYRESVLWQITAPVWQATHKLGAWIWWNNLEHVMQAIDDLGCREFLG
jgi:hypothetical protein